MQNAVPICRRMSAIRTINHFFVFGIARAEPLASVSAMLSRSLTWDGVIYHV
jgi:hypothetical protein